MATVDPDTMSLREMKDFLEVRSVSYQGLLEKQEFRNLVRKTIQEAVASSPKPPAAAGPASAVSQSSKYKPVDGGPDVAFFMDEVKKLANEFFDICDVASLRACHKKFKQIMPALVEYWEGDAMHQYAAANCVAWMGEDAVLRDKMIADDTLLDRIEALMATGKAGAYYALKAVRTLTSPGGEVQRANIKGRFQDAIFRLVDTNPCQELVIESFSCLAHFGPDAGLDASSEMVNLASELAMGAWVKAHDAYHARVWLAGLGNYTGGSPSKGNVMINQSRNAKRALIAGLCCPVYEDRLDLMASLVNAYLCYGMAESVDQMTEHPVQRLQQTPQRVLDVVIDSERSVLLPDGLAMTEYFRSVQDVLSRRSPSAQDFFTLGQTVAKCIMEGEFAVQNALFQAPPGVLTYSCFFDVVKEALKKMKGKPKYYAEYSLISMKIAVVERNYSRARSLAREAFRKTEDGSVEARYRAAFCYFASLDASSSEIVEWCERGLSLGAGVTMQIKTSLLMLLGEEAFSAAAQEEQDALRKQKYDNALKVLEQVVAEAAFDHRAFHRRHHEYIRILLIVKGDTVSTKKLRALWKKQAVYEEFAKCVYSVDDGPLQKLTKFFGENVDAFELGKALFKDTSFRDCGNGCPEDHRGGAHGPGRCILLDEQRHGHGHRHAHGCGGHKEKASAKPMKNCVACGNPSAKLMMCAGCQNARYCSRECQKRHWKMHKTDCQAQKK